MQVDAPENIRNIALAGHGDTGKTTLASAMLYTSGANNRMGRVEDGNATTDFDQEEIERGNSISLGICWAPWRQHKVNVIDTPGMGLFGVEARAGIRAADVCVLAVGAVSGVEVQTERMGEYAAEIALPVVFHVTKMDRDNADFARTVAALRERFGTDVRPIQVPIGQEQGFTGVVDLVTGKAWRYDRDGDGKGEEVAVPDDLAEAVDEARRELVEAVAETDEFLLEQYFDKTDLSQEELTRGLRRAIRRRAIFPITASSALHGIGTGAFLDTVVDLFPNPLQRETFPASDLGGEARDVETTADGPLAALVFKTWNDPFSGKVSFARVVSGTLAGDSTVWNVRSEESEKSGHLHVYQGKQGTLVQKLVTGDIGGLTKLKHTHSGDTLGDKAHPVQLGWIEVRPPAISFAIEPKTKGDEEKISEALHRLMEEDLGLRSGRDPQTGEVLLAGSGQLHVEIAVSRLKNRYKVDLVLHPPKVPYRETIKRPADGHGRHKKQTGGRGQFADCKIRIEPMPAGSEFEFVDEIFGGAIPQGFRPAVEKGIQEARRRGYLAGFPVVDFRVRLRDGQYHDVDSSEMAFKIAGSLAWKDAMAQAAPTILEPIMDVEITTSEEFMGDIMGDLSQRRGRPQGMETQGGMQVIKATVPMSEMLDYAPALRSITQGRARFTMELGQYEEMPRNIQEKVIAEAKRGHDDEH